MEKKLKKEIQSLMKARYGKNAAIIIVQNILSMIYEEKGAF